MPDVGEGAIPAHLLVDVRLELAHAVSEDDHLAPLRLVSQMSQLVLLELAQVVLFVLLEQPVDDCLTAHLEKLPSGQHGVVDRDVVCLDVESPLTVPLHVIHEDPAVLVLVCSSLSLEMLLR